MCCYRRPVSSVVKHIAIHAGGLGSIPGLDKIDNAAKDMLPLRRFFGAILLRRYETEMRPPLVTRFGAIPRVYRTLDLI